MGTLSHNTAWEGSTTQNSQEQTYTFSTGGKYSDKDIKFKVSAKSGTIGTIGMTGAANADGTYTVTASQTNTTGWTSGNKSNTYTVDAASIGNISMSGPTYNSSSGKYEVGASQTNSAGYYSGGNKSNSLSLTNAVVSANSPTINITSVTKNATTKKITGSGTATTSVSVGTAGYITSTTGTKNTGTVTANVEIAEYQPGYTSFGITASKDKKIHINAGADTGFGYVSNTNGATLVMDHDYNFSTSEMQTLLSHHEFEELSTIPFTVNSMGVFCHAYKNVICVFDPTSKKYYEYSITNGTWTTKSDASGAPHDRDVTCLVGDTIYQFGYDSVPDPQMPFNYHSILNSNEDGFTTSSSTWLVNNVSQAVVNKEAIGGQIIFMGGYSSTYKNYVTAFNIVNSTYTTISTSMNSTIATALYNAGACKAAAQKIYCGAYPGTSSTRLHIPTYSGKLYITTTYGRTLTSTYDFGGTIYGPTTMVSKGKYFHLYAFTCVNLNRITIFNSDTNTFSSIYVPSGMNSSFAYGTGTCACEAEGDIYVVGGSESKLTRIRTAYNIDKY